jgi:Excreted virulence factor EspC, type VII ESX diderm
VPSQVEMPLEAVRRHAGSVGSVAAAVQTAHQAANQVYLDVAAFGQLCSFVPSLFDPVLRGTVEAIEGAADTLQQTAGRLRFAADLSEAADEVSSATVQRAGDHSIDLPL